jgi:hypothetical protein
MRIKRQADKRSTRKIQKNRNNISSSESLGKGNKRQKRHNLKLIFSGEKKKKPTKLC